MDKKTKTLSYKIATNVPTGTTLQQLLTDRLESLPLAKDRLQRLRIDGSDFRLINEKRYWSKMAFGALYCYTAGAAQLILDIIETTKEFKMEAFRPNTADKKIQREFVNGVLFFGVWKNHLILLQSQQCRAAQLEDHLSWILSDGPTGDSEADGEEDENEEKAPRAQILLADPPAKKLKAKKDLPVTGVKFKTGIELSHHTTEEAGRLEARPRSTQVKSASLQVRPSGSVWKSLKELLKSTGAKMEGFDDVDFDEAVRAQDISVDIRLSCTKKSADSAGTLISHFSHAMRNVEGADYVLELSDGSKIRGKDLKASRPFRLECDHNIPVQQQLHKAMITYLRDLIDNGTVSDTEQL